MIALAAVIKNETWLARRNEVVESYALVFLVDIPTGVLVLASRDRRRSFKLIVAFDGFLASAPQNWTWQATPSRLVHQCFLFFLDSRGGISFAQPLDLQTLHTAAFSCTIDSSPKRSSWHRLLHYECTAGISNLTILHIDKGCIKERSLTWTMDPAQQTVMKARLQPITQQNSNHPSVNCPDRHDNI